jgi:putative SOS response-associated peptidase YedK
MCGRFAFYSPTEATAALFGASGSLQIEPHYNVAPTQYVAAIRAFGPGALELTAMRWGLIPSWARDPSIGSRMINARAETVREKPAFRVAYRKRRCLVLADGFYEWHTEGTGKTPYFVSLASAQAFAFAGLWEDWQDRESGESIRSTALITTQANEFMMALHHRMPVVLEPGTAGRWLGGGDDALAYAVEHTPRLRAWPVDRSVNNPRNEGASLITARGALL